MAEFAALKSEIAELVKQTGTYMTFAIASFGAITTWLLTNPMPSEVVLWARWLPLTVSGLFGSLAAAAYLRMGEKGVYLRKIDERLSAAGLGWEKEFSKRPRIMGAFYTLSWGALNLAGLITGLALPFPQATT
jgi:hypothetical protein